LLTSADSRNFRFTRLENSNITHWIGGWVGSTANVDVTKNINLLPVPELEARLLDV
jgi:hypothetical protein